MTTTTMMQSQSNQAQRLLYVVPASFTVTFGLFALMDVLTHSDGVPQPPPPAVVIDDFTFQETPQHTQVKVKLVEPPEPPVVPERENITPDPSQKPGFESEYVKFKPPTVSTGVDPSLSFSEGTASPIVRMEPKYPPAAARDGIEGWVKLVFSIDGSGQVFDIQVVDAQPKRTFDREARRALSKWRYKPQIVQGKPAVQSGLEVVLEFKLEQS